MTACEKKSQAEMSDKQGQAQNGGQNQEKECGQSQNGGKNQAK